MRVGGASPTGGLLRIPPALGGGILKEKQFQSPSPTGEVLKIHCFRPLFFDVHFFENIWFPLREGGGIQQINLKPSFIMCHKTIKLPTYVHFRGKNGKNGVIFLNF